MAKSSQINDQIRVKSSSRPHALPRIRRDEVWQNFYRGGGFKNLRFQRFYEYILQPTLIYIIVGEKPKCPKCVLVYPQQNTQQMGYYILILPVQQRFSQLYSIRLDFGFLIPKPVLSYCLRALVKPILLSYCAAIEDEIYFNKFSVLFLFSFVKLTNKCEHIISYLTSQFY